MVDNNRTVQGVVVKCDCGNRRIIPADGDYVILGKVICTHCGKEMHTEIVAFDKEK
jgi:hypothetical protein